MCDKELLVSYVYDELDGGERKALQQHLASCRDCRDEAQRLKGVRVPLAAWTVPDTALDLRLDPAVAPRARVRLPPRWGLAAAAAILVAVAASFANVELRAVDGGFVVSAGWGALPAAPAAQPSITPGEVLALQERIRSLETVLQDRQPVAVPVAADTAAPRPADDAELVRRVRAWIRESEDRQQQALANRLLQVMREMQAAHSTDLVRLERAFKQEQGQWSDELLRHREEVKQVYRVLTQAQLQR